MAGSTIGLGNNAVSNIQKAIDDYTKYIEGVVTSKNITDICMKHYAAGTGTKTLLTQMDTAIQTKIRDYLSTIRNYKQAISAVSRQYSAIDSNNDTLTNATTSINNIKS